MAEGVQSDLATASAHNAMAATQLWMGEFTDAVKNSAIAIETSATTSIATCR